MTEDVRKCPWCAEYVKREAKVCRFCGHDLTELFSEGDERRDPDSAGTVGAADGEDGGIRREIRAHEAPLAAAALESTRPGTFGWLTLATGVAATLCMVTWISSVMETSGALTPGTLSTLVLQALLSVAALGLGVAAIIKQDRRWPTWVGLSMDLLPMTVTVVAAISRFG